MTLKILKLKFIGCDEDFAHCTLGPQISVTLGTKSSQKFSHTCTLLAHLSLGFHLFSVPNLQENFSHSHTFCTLGFWISSCVWDLLLYYFSKVPQPFHGCWAWVGQVSVRSHRWSEPGAFWQDVVRRLLRGTTQTGCWGAEAPAVHAGTETTYSSAEAVQGDPLSAREISSWWDVCAR